MATFDYDDGQRVRIRVQSEREKCLEIVSVTPQKTQ